MTAINVKSRNKGRIAASVYTVIIVMLLFLKMCSPVPKEDYDNEGIIMVNLGFTETGKTDNVPESVEEEIQEEVPEEIVEEVTPEVIEESVTQDIVEVDVSAQEQPVTETTEPTEQVEEPSEPVEEKPVADPNSAFNSGMNNPNQGDGTENGDKGIEDGNLESDIYGNISGSGLGDSGKGWGLNGRSLGNKPTPVSEEQIYGKVTIKIYVAKNGKVTKAVFSNIGSTTTKKYLIDLSIKEAYKVTFNSDPKAPSTQIGFVTFHYKAS